jgi:SAM-dependent methyltransferase
VCDRVWATGPLGIRLDDVDEFDGLPAQGRPMTRLIASYRSGLGARAAAVHLADLAPAVGKAAEIDWRHIHADCPPVIVGPHELSIDPGPTFGWGGHPSTRLVLDWLADHPPTRARVLDVGCGSGVLSVAAAALGAASVMALDVDPAAVQATAVNAATNGVAAAVATSQQPLADLEASFDVVVANLPAGEHLALAPHMDRCCPSGLLCLSGFLAQQTGSVTGAHPSRPVLSARVLDGWACVLMAGTGGALSSRLPGPQPSRHPARCATMPPWARSTT